MLRVLLFTVRVIFSQLQLIIDDQRAERTAFGEAVGCGRNMHVYTDCKPSVCIVFQHYTCFRKRLLQVCVSILLVLNESTGRF